MKLATAIQHHPERATLLAPLLEALGGSVVIVSDPDPEAERRSAWRTYRHALENAPSGASHLLILQDDVLPVPFALAGARLAAAIHPCGLLSLFVAGKPQEAAQRLLRACQRDEPLVEIGARRWVPAVALIWPVEVIPEALAFVDAKNWPERFNADDEIIGHIARHLKLEVWATVPSLIEHEDIVPSVAGGRRSRGGRDPGRTAACFIPDLDPREIDWR